MSKWLVRAGVGAVALFFAMQLVPYGRNHTNPPVSAEPSWNSAQTRELAKNACFDCHSNLTAWPWYTNVAPVSWLTYRDVVGGRAALNFSEWNRPQDGAGDIAEAISSGSMPPVYYKPLHPRSQLSAKERAQLIAGLAATLRRSPPR